MNVGRRKFTSLVLVFVALVNWNEIFWLVKRNQLKIFTVLLNKYDPLLGCETKNVIETIKLVKIIIFFVLQNNIEIPHGHNFIKIVEIFV